MSSYSRSRTMSSSSMLNEYTSTSMQQQQAPPPQQQQQQQQQQGASGGPCTACTDQPSNMMFVCGKCNRSTHYGCTKLPPYMLHQLIKKEEKAKQKKKPKKFVCQDCTGDVPNEIARHAVDAVEVMMSTSKDHKKNVETSLRGTESLVTEVNEKQSKYRSMLSENKTTITRLAELRKSLVGYTSSSTSSEQQQQEEQKDQEEDSPRKSVGFSRSGSRYGSRPGSGSGMR